MTAQHDDVAQLPFAMLTAVALTGGIVLTAIRAAFEAGQR